MRLIRLINLFALEIFLTLELLRGKLLSEPRDVLSELGKGGEKGKGIAGGTRQSQGFGRGEMPRSPQRVQSPCRHHALAQGRTWDDAVTGGSQGWGHIAEQHSQGCSHSLARTKKYH